MSEQNLAAKLAEEIAPILWPARYSDWPAIIESELQPAFDLLQRIHELSKKRAKGNERAFGEAEDTLREINSQIREHMGDL